jgi:CDP-diacylglycerol---serine O-phosphatidyltransferase
MTARMWRAHLADSLSLANGSSGVAGILLLLTWDDPRALAAACALVFIGWGFDSVDGLAARGLGRPRAVGEVMDSLCDVGSFGVLPAVLLTMAWVALDRFTVVGGAVIGVLFFCCVVVRLRRYTVHAVSEAATKRLFFEGLPSPVAAMSVAASILASLAEPALLAWTPFIFAGVCGPLMVSRIPFKDTPGLAVWLVRALWPIPVLALLVYAAGAAITVTIFFTAYLASGVLGLHKPR